MTKPAFPFKHKDLPPENISRREQIAKWTTSKSNPYFAKSYVNRTWSYLLGVGIIGAGGRHPRRGTRPPIHSSSTG